MTDTPSSPQQPQLDSNMPPLQDGSSVQPIAVNPQSVPVQSQETLPQQPIVTNAQAYSQPVSQGLPTQIVQPVQQFQPVEPPVQQQFVEPTIPVTPVMEQPATQMPTPPLVRQPPVPNDEKIWAALSYIPMMALLALIVKPRSAYVKLHGRQGLLLFGIFILALFASFFFYIVLPTWLVLLLWSLLQIGLFIIGVYSIYQALISNWWKIPMLGDLAEKIPVESFTKIASEAITGQPVEDNQNDPDGNNQNMNGGNQA